MNSNALNKMKKASEIEAPTSSKANAAEAMEENGVPF
jgi:hypothetical protein